MKSKMHLALLVFIFMPFLLFAADETLTITTYYPSPYGSYNEFKVASNTYLAYSSGSVGIGTTIPGAKLDVLKSITTNVVNSLAMFGYGGGLTNRSIVVEQIGTPTTGNQFIFLNGHLGSSSVTGTPTLTSTYAPTFGIESNDSNLNLITATAGTNVAAIRALSVNSTGNVGIGTTSPGVPLDIKRAHAAAYGTLIPLINLNAYYPGYDENAQRATIEAGVPPVSFGNTTYGWIAFQTRGADGLVERMTIYPNGNVGIGTTAPGYTLTVGQNTASNNTDYNLAILRHGTLASPGTYTAGTPALTISDISGDGPTTLDTQGLLQVSAGRIADSDTYAANAVLFSVNNDNGVAFRVMGNRNVGIWTASPGAKLTLRIDAGDPSVGSNAFELASATKWWRVGVNTDANGGGLLFSGSDNTSGWKCAYRFNHDGNAYADVTWNAGGADYAEWFEKEGDIPKGSLIGLSLVTGKARVWQKGDPFMGVQSVNPGFVGNNVKGAEVNEDEMRQNYVLVALIGQTEIKSENIIEEGRKVMTTDGQFIGWKLANGKVYLK